MRSLSPGSGPIRPTILNLKPNGIAGKNGATMASNKELVLEVVKGVMAAGVPAANSAFAIAGRVLGETEPGGSEPATA